MTEQFKEWVLMSPHSQNKKLNSTKLTPVLKIRIQIKNITKPSGKNRFLQKNKKKNTVEVSINVRSLKFLYWLNDESSFYIKTCEKNCRIFFSAKPEINIHEIDLHQNKKDPTHYFKPT